MNIQTTYCGSVAIVGQANVGKSTLLNQLLGQKVSITSRKPQTTRHCIMGINTKWPYQTVYVDTPGFHVEEKRVVNHLIDRSTVSFVDNVELVILVVEGTYWPPSNEIVLNKLRDVNCPVIMAINKVDNVSDKKKLLPHIQFLSQRMAFYAIVPICAKNGMNVDTLASIVRKVLPKSKHYFPEGYITNRSRYFMASEIIREKLMRFLGNELPYSVTVKIERFATNDRGDYDIHGLILVKRKSQKKMIIGNKGSKIKIISIEARKDMEAMFKTRVYLELWVKVISGWADNEHILYNLDYVNKF